jgi:nitrite reductase/ring-hydroxylating ferredoxin subunit
VTPAARKPRRRVPLDPLVARIEAARPLDAPAGLVARTVRKVVRPGPVKDALSGTWLGHALHPMLTDVVLGSLLSASMLDLLGGDDDGKASERLIAVGLVMYGPTALTGASDWTDSERGDAAVRRTGLVHATVNSAALSLYTASLAARRRGHRRRGALLGAGGATALAAGGYLGGHLTLARGIGTDQTVFDAGPSDWVAAAESAEVPEGTPTRVVVEDTPVLLLRHQGRLTAIHDRCSHRGCSLSAGDIEGDEIVCPCHGSRFGLLDGSLRRGPATAPQPAFQTREEQGRVEIRLPPPPGG